MVTKKTVLKKVRNIAISAVILLLVLIGAGVGYTWYMSQYDAAPTVAAPKPVEKEGTITHVKVAENANANASIQSLTTPVMPGNNASVSVKGNPGSTCTIVVEYNKIPSKDSGLIRKPTDEFGVVTWSWTVESTVPVGKWPVTVTCEYNKKTAVVIGDLIVTNTIEED